MMWFFGKHSRRDRGRARKDASSLGNMLLRMGVVDGEQLRLAIDYQDNNPDVMLGEALINMGAVDRGIVEALLVAQSAARNEGKTADVIAFATRHTQQTVHKAHDDLNDLVTSLNGKVSKVRS